MSYYVFVCQCTHFLCACIFMDLCVRVYDTFLLLFPYVYTFFKNACACVGLVCDLLTERGLEVLAVYYVCFSCVHACAPSVSARLRENNNHNILTSNTFLLGSTHFRPTHPSLSYMLPLCCLNTNNKSVQNLTSISYVKHIAAC